MALDCSKYESIRWETSIVKLKLIRTGKMGRHKLTCKSSQLFIYMKTEGFPISINFLYFFPQLFALLDMYRLNNNYVINFLDDSEL